MADDIIIEESVVSSEDQNVLDQDLIDLGEKPQVKEPQKDLVLGKLIFERIISMLINEAFDALFMNVSSKEDIEIAMTKGVNYPKGLFQWADELGLDYVLSILSELFEEYGEDRYRPNPLLKRIVRDNN